MGYCGVEFLSLLTAVARGVWPGRLGNSRSAPRLCSFATDSTELMMAELKYMMSVFGLKVHRSHAYSGRLLTFYLE